MKERRVQEILLFAPFAHPDLLDEIAEEFAEIELKAADLDRLRQEILNLPHREPGLDAVALKHHLCTHGYSAEVAALESPALAEHVSFARRYGADRALMGWREALSFWRDTLTAAKERESRSFAAVRVSRQKERASRQPINADRRHSARQQHLREPLSGGPTPK